MSGPSDEPQTYLISAENLECLNIHIIYIFNVETNLLNLSSVKNMFLAGKSWIATKERGRGFYKSLEKELVLEAPFIRGLKENSLNKVMGS